MGASNPQNRGALPCEIGKFHQTVRAPSARTVRRAFCVKPRSAGGTVINLRLGKSVNGGLSVFVEDDEDEAVGGFAELGCGGGFLLGGVISAAFDLLVEVGFEGLGNGVVLAVGGFNEDNLVEVNAHKLGVEGIIGEICGVEAKEGVDFVGVGDFAHFGKFDSRKRCLSVFFGNALR